MMPFLANDEDEASVVRAHLDADFQLGDFTIYNGWLCIRVHECTCGRSSYGEPCEPGCGLEPMVDLVEIDGPRSGRHVAPPSDPPYPGVF